MLIDTRRLHATQKLFGRAFLQSSTSDIFVPPLCHRFYAGDAFYQSTSNTEILNELARIINGADVGTEIYQPTQAVIVTWEILVSMYQSF